MRSAHTLEAILSHDTANQPAHQRHADAAFTPACFALPSGTAPRKRTFHHLCSSSHLHRLTSAHLHLHLHSCTSTSSLRIYISAHLHILTSTSLLIFTSSHLHISHLHLSLFFTFSLKAGGGTTGAPRNAPRNAGEIAYWPCPAQPSVEIARVEGAKCRRDCVLALSGATLCGDRACRGREMQVRLRFGFAQRNPLRRSCVSRARNAGEIAFWICRGRPSAEIVRVEGAKRR